MSTVDPMAQLRIHQTDPKPRPFHREKINVRKMRRKKNNMSRRIERGVRPVYARTRPGRLRFTARVVGVFCFVARRCFCCGNKLASRESGMLNIPRVCGVSLAAGREYRCCGNKLANREPNILNIPGVDGIGSLTNIKICGFGAPEKHEYAGNNHEKTCSNDDRTAQRCHDAFLYVRVGAHVKKITDI